MRLILVSNSFILNGLVIYSLTPNSNPLTTLSSSSTAVKIIVGIFKSLILFSYKLKPFPSGKVTSKIIKSILLLLFK